MLGVRGISGMGNLLSVCWVVGVTGGFLGHHVKARTGLARGPVKAVSPALRGRSAAKSLDRGETSRTIRVVMAGLGGVRTGVGLRARVLVSRGRGRARRGEPAFDVRFVLPPKLLQPALFVMDDETKHLPHGTDLRSEQPR